MAGRSESARGQHSEYGGGDGTPGRLPDGSPRPLGDVAGSVGERARLLRMAGMADYDPSNLKSSALVAEAADIAAIAAGRRAALGAAGLSEGGAVGPAAAEAVDHLLERASANAEAEERLRLRTNGYIDEPGDSGGDYYGEAVK